MPINIDYYVGITSGVGAAENIPARQLIPMIFDDNPLIPSGSFVNFPNHSDGASNVKAYFGSSSEEYKRALFAFGWISKEITVIPSMSFGRWNTIACAPVIYGASSATTKVIGTWTSVTSGSFTLVMGATSHTLTGLNFSGAATLADVAGIVQSAVQAITGGGSLWTGADVTYNSTAGRFELVGGATGAAVISVAAAVSNDVASLLGWLSVLTILGPGAAAQEPVDAVTAMNTLNNNFGSFAFIGSLSSGQIVTLATANEAFNELYMYSIPVNAAGATAMQSAVGAIGACTTTLTANISQYEEQIPMMIMGATNYSGLNTTQNYMFQQFPTIAPTVTDITTAEAYDAIGVNYYANTQQSGQLVNLYQRGQMNGGVQDASAQNTYANEVWLKGALTSALMTLLLDLNKISANNTGVSQVLAILQSTIKQALNNGTISVGRTLTPTEVLYITNATGDNTVWQQVQNIGYWVTATITTAIVNSKTQYIINYTLIYAQDAVVNKIEGTDILI